MATVSVLHGKGIAQSQRQRFRRTLVKNLSACDSGRGCLLANTRRFPFDWEAPQKIRREKSSRLARGIFSNRRETALVLSSTKNSPAGRTLSRAVFSIKFHCLLNRETPPMPLPSTDFLCSLRHDAIRPKGSWHGPHAIPALERKQLDHAA